VTSVQYADVVYVALWGRRVGLTCMVWVFSEIPHVSCLIPLDLIDMMYYGWVIRTGESESKTPLTASNLKTPSKASPLEDDRAAGS